LRGDDKNRLKICRSANPWWDLKTVHVMHKETKINFCKMESSWNYYFETLKLQPLLSCDPVSAVQTKLSADHANCFCGLNCQFIRFGKISVTHGTGFCVSNCQLFGFGTDFAHRICLFCVLILVRLILCKVDIHGLCGICQKFCKNWHQDGQKVTLSALPLRIFGFP
jgi:hypothetical protein